MREKRKGPMLKDGFLFDRDVSKAASFFPEKRVRKIEQFFQPSLKETLQAYCKILREYKDYQAQGVHLPKGLLLHGPPGCGKTQIAKTLSAKAGLHFIALSTADTRIARQHDLVGDPKTLDEFDSLGQWPCRHVPQPLPTIQIPC